MYDIIRNMRIGISFCLISTLVLRAGEHLSSVSNLADGHLPTRRRSLFFGRSRHPFSRISALENISLADNFLQKQQKQRANRSEIRRKGRQRTSRMAPVPV
jgi:hypothetical protein